MEEQSAFSLPDNQECVQADRKCSDWFPSNSEGAFQLGLIQIAPVSALSSQTCTAKQCAAFCLGTEASCPVVSMSTQESPQTDRVSERFKHEKPWHLSALSLSLIKDPAFSPHLWHFPIAVGPALGVAWPISVPL